MWPPLLLAVGCWCQCPGCGRRCLLGPMELGRPNNHRGVFLQNQLHFVHARHVEGDTPLHNAATGCCLLYSMSLAQSATCCCPFRRRSTDTQQGPQTSVWPYSAANSSRHHNLAMGLPFFLVQKVWTWLFFTATDSQRRLPAEAASLRPCTLTATPRCTMLQRDVAFYILCPWHSLQPAAARLGGGVRTRSRVRRRLCGRTPLQTHHDISQPGHGPPFLLGSKSLDMAVLHSHRLTEASSCRSSFTSSMHVDGDTALHNAATGCCLLYSMSLA